MQVNTRAALGQLSDMDIRLLRVFKTVVDCGGMAAAELELNIGTSTVSRHIKDLETRLGLTLCRRGRAGFALTPEGEQIYAETLRLLAGVDAFRSRVDEIHQRMGGELHLAVFDKTASNPEAFIGEAIALFQAQAPGVSLHLHVAPLNVIERGVIDGQFQVGVVPGHRTSGALVYDELFSETMYLYCGLTHPLFGADAAQQPGDWAALHAHAFAGLGYHSPNMELAQKVQLTRQATGYDQESIATLILSGRYLGFLPDHYAESFVRQGRLRAVQPSVFNYRCSFFGIVRASPQAARVTLAFQACLHQAHAAGRATLAA
ncbi:LysR family transcriptional regulator [Rhodoferax sp. U11-2br]|uniref:LysR family transcriptional regulator n=1 Tax=Rhodoferax sp. U11-2br TaxID=2838878 RepID=UPI001BE54799|nr:LysR family transcriptional regulator [Rhodoferax sp. U11-2br]MBT3067017.1 LysR family transcriptional regulator [Rhodoferax sp. U11-2br]